MGKTGQWGEEDVRSLDRQGKMGGGNPGDNSFEPLNALETIRTARFGGRDPERRLMPSDGAFPAD
ncbi:hypothetical protein D8666_12380 [Ochrobactrum soli]|nr:hypothetical protein D8666_12380 [[Ochrobactrum] soli]